MAEAKRRAAEAEQLLQQQADALHESNICNEELASELEVSKATAATNLKALEEALALAMRDAELAKAVRRSPTICLCHALPPHFESPCSFGCPATAHSS